MKIIKVKYFICLILLTNLISIWLGYSITSSFNFPEYIIWPISVFLIGAILFIALFNRIFLQIVVIIASLVLCIPLISMSKGMTFENLTNHKLNILCVDINSLEIRRGHLVPKQNLRLSLCKGDSPNQFKDKIFLVLVTDANGKIYYQELVKIAELEKYKNIIINSPLNIQNNDPNDNQPQIE